MNLILNLPPETEAKLFAQASAVGKAPEEFALAALQERLAAGLTQPAAKAEAAPEAISAEEWIADIRKWAEGHRHLPYEADDSRESIYVGREE